MCFVVAFGNDSGMSVLIERIRAQLARLELVQAVRLSIFVSYKRVRRRPADSVAPVDSSVRATAADIAQLINAESYTRSVRQ